MMSSKFNLEESLSALMDGEVGDLELRRILKVLPEQNELQGTWERYHLIGAALKRETHSRLSVDILSGVKRRLENEATPQFNEAGLAKNNHGLLRILGQGTIAAAVAMLVLSTVGSITGTDSSPIFSSNTLELASSPDPIPSPSTLEFNGNYTASEFSRVVSFDETRENPAKDRLIQAVYQEFEEILEPERAEIQMRGTSANN